MRVLVTGSSGFIGQHVVKRLEQEKGVTQVLGLSRRSSHYLDNPDGFTGFQDVYCDVSIESHVARIMLVYKPEVVFHLAGHATTKSDDQQPTLISKQNILATHNLLAFCQPGTRFVLASSSAVYGDNAWNKSSEDTALEPTSAYGATKVAAEALVSAYGRQGKVKELRLRYVANVGAGCTHGLLKDIVAKLKSSSPTLDLIGDSPGSIKPFIHVQDTASATVQLGMSHNTTGPFNVSPADNLSVLEVANLVMNTLKVTKPINWLGKKANWAGDNPNVSIGPWAMRSWGCSQRFATSRQAIHQAVLDMEASA